MLKKTAWAFSVLTLICCVSCAKEDDDGVKNTGATGGTGAATTGGFGGFSTGGTEAGLGGLGGTSGSAGSSGASGASGAGGSGGGGDAGPPVTVMGSTLSLSAPITAISGFSVCVYQNPSVPCVQSDSNGDYSLTGVPGNSELLLEFKKTGYFNVLRTITTTTVTADVGSANYPTTTEASLFATLVGTTLDATKGQVLFTALQPGTSSLTGQDGVTAIMSPNSGSGPHYIQTGPPVAPSASLTATDTLGFGLYANVNPGTVEVTLTHSSKTCKRLVIGSFAGSGPTVSKVPVIAGYLTAGAALECP